MNKLQETKKGAALSSVNFSKGEDGKKQEIRVSVEEIKNGFLITKNTEGKDAKGNWQYLTEKWYSDTNPLSINTDNKPLADLFE